MNKLGVVKNQISRNEFIACTFDRRSEVSFNKVKSLVTSIKGNLENKFTFIIGNFSDADEDKLQVSHSTARSFALSNNC